MLQMHNMKACQLFMGVS